MLIVYTDGTEVIVCTEETEEATFRLYFEDADGRMLEDDYDRLTDAEQMELDSNLSLYERRECAQSVYIPAVTLTVETD